MKRSIEVLLAERRKLDLEIETAAIEHLQYLVALVSYSQTAAESVTLGFNEDGDLEVLQAFDAADDEIRVFFDDRSRLNVLREHGHLLRPLWDGVADSVIVEFNPGRVQNVRFVE